MPLKPAAVASSEGVTRRLRTVQSACQRECVVKCDIGERNPITIAPRATALHRRRSRQYPIAPSAAKDRDHRGPAHRAGYWSIDEPVGQTSDISLCYRLRLAVVDIFASGPAVIPAPVLRQSEFFERSGLAYTTGTWLMLFFGSIQNDSFTKRLKISRGRMGVRSIGSTFGRTVCNPGIPTRASNSSAW